MPTSPVNVVDNIEPDGQDADGAPHVVPVRTPDPRLVWYKEIAARSSQRIAAMGVFNNLERSLRRHVTRAFRSPQTSTLV